jgi:hypothetical protein
MYHYSKSAAIINIYLISPGCCFRNDSSISHHMSGPAPARRREIWLWETLVWIDHIYRLKCCCLLRIYTRLDIPYKKFYSLMGLCVSFWHHLWKRRDWARPSGRRDVPDPFFPPIGRGRKKKKKRRGTFPSPARRRVYTQHLNWNLTTGSLSLYSIRSEGKRRRRRRRRRKSRGPLLFNFSLPHPSGMRYPEYTHTREKARLLLLLGGGK